MAKSEGARIIRTEGVLNAVTYVISTIAFLSVVRYVGISFSVAFICIFVVALYFDYRRRYAVSRAALNIALVFFAVLNALRINIDDLATPVVETLLILIVIKLVEEKKPRDYLQVYLLAVFLLTGSALLSVDMQFLLMLVMLAFLLPVSVVLLTFHSQQSGMTLTSRDLGSIVSRALLIAIASLPVMVLLFVILPRTSFPMLNILSRGGVTGFTDTVRLGAISDIQENNAVILRVEADIIDPSMLYWRGIVLDHFDGISWKSLNREHQTREKSAISGNRVSQVIYLEPYGNNYLFALDKPAFVYLRNATIWKDLTMTTRQNIEKLTKYSALSVVSNTFIPDGIDKATYLQLPDRDFSRIEALVKKLFYGKSKEAAVNAILRYLKNGGFSYSLKNLPVTGNPVEDFLFIYKYGNCEYFASSMAVMLRLGGIPARLVGGYLGGQYNDYGRYYLVTQNMAHVWVEAYIDGKGWIRVDPTPGTSGSPANIGQGSFLQNARLYIDLINYYWNVMVIDYDFDKQISLFAGLRNLLKSPFRASFSFRDFMPALAYILAVIIIVVISVYALLRKKSVEKRLVGRFVAKMKKYGYERLPYEGLEEFARREGPLELREKALRFAAEFEAIYYRDRKMTREERRSLSRMIDEI
jgi:protein-glutamine gamma-glutamyltransferase